MQSNPIQQRIELICGKWEEAKAHTNARIVNIRCQPDEKDMVNNFYTYMIGADTEIMDIAFHFDSACEDPELFSTLLLEELEETIDIWNNSQKDGRIDYVPVHWKADRSFEKDKNPAAVFVHNFNNLARELDLQEGLFVVAIFKGRPVPKLLISWLQNAIKAGISPAVKFLIHDTSARPFFEELNRRHPSFLTTIPLDLDMPRALEQTAAMGDPGDPATGYRHTFMKMMNAMGAEKEGEAEKWGKECIKTAVGNISKDPFWITQVVVVYIALANDKIRYKKREETLDYANKAVEAATAAKDHFENEIAGILLAQSVMFRGTVFYINKRRTEAYTDFKLAYELYRGQGNLPLAIEACRMAGESALRGGQNENVAKILSEGVRFGGQMETATAAATTYAGLLDLLLQTNYAAFISMDKLNEIAGNIYGPNWITVVKSWKKLPDPGQYKQQETAAAAS